MKRQSGSIALAFLIVLALSIAANAFLWHRITVEHDARTAAETKFDTQRTATETCNKSIAGLEMAAEERGRQGEKARTAAADRRRKAEQDAQQILSTPATTPGNDCKSAQDRVRNWLKARKP